MSRWTFVVHLFTGCAGSNWCHSKPKWLWGRQSAEQCDIGHFTTKMFLKRGFKCNELHVACSGAKKTEDLQLLLTGWSNAEEWCSLLRFPPLWPSWLNCVCCKSSWKLTEFATFFVCQVAKPLLFLKVFSEMWQLSASCQSPLRWCKRELSSV